MARKNRLVAAAGIALSVFSTAASTQAEGICDAAGHFCIHVDTTSASVCDLLRPGDLDPDTCSVQDIKRRERARNESPRPMRALTVRFDDWWALVMVTRVGLSGEVGPNEIAATAQSFRTSLAREVDSIDGFAEPTVRRVHDVQTVWFDTQVTRNGGRAEEIDVEVRAADASYAISFHGPPGARLHAFAESSLSTLDTLPAKASRGPGEAISWIARGVVIAVVLAFAGWWVGKRKKSAGLEARDLWPR